MKNTVRYRINNLKEILNYGKSEVDFLETLSMIYKIHKLLTPSTHTSKRRIKYETENV